jgi:tetratricopeptide (TPR) repeat protein
MFRSLIVAVALAALGSVADAATPLETAVVLMANYHEDLSRLDRARELLEQAVATTESPELLTAVARACLLQGEFRARTPDDRLATYQRGREAGAAAIELAPRSGEAHLWYVANLGRWAETRGVMRALSLVPQIRREFDLLLTIKPTSADILFGAGRSCSSCRDFSGATGPRGTAPAARAGDRCVAHGARVGLARVLIAKGAVGEAREQLQRVLDTRAATDLPRWTLQEVPRARQLLRLLAVGD